MGIVTLNTEEKKNQPIKNHLEIKAKPSMHAD